MALLPEPEAIAREILDIFVHRFNCRPNEVLSVQNFRAALDERHIRREDFKPGMEFAAEQKWVEVVSDGTAFRLTDLGFSAATSLESAPIGNSNAVTRARDRELMLRAIELARKCKSEPGKVSPMVGAVIARDGVVIGEAYRGEIEPGEHAEFTLLERKLADVTLAGATLYATLEPCTSRNHPKIPCAERIVDRRIKRVFIGVVDPNPDISGLGQLRLREAGIEVVLFDPDLAPVIEELNRDFSRQYVRGLQRERTIAQTSDPVQEGQLGPNGHRIGYTENGDKVEWLPDEDNPGKEWALLLRRNDNDILKAYNERWDKIWWYRHQGWLRRIKSGEEAITEAQVPVLEQAKKAAQKLEQKYGRKALNIGDSDVAILTGQMSAIAWVLGAEWDESFDT